MTDPTVKLMPKLTTERTCIIGHAEMKSAVMKKEYEIKTAKAKLQKLKSLERNIKNNREEIQSETSKSHQRYSSPGCNNSRNAFKKK